MIGGARPVSRILTRNHARNRVAAAGMRKPIAAARGMSNTPPCPPSPPIALRVFYPRPIDRGAPYPFVGRPCRGAANFKPPSCQVGGRARLIGHGCLVGFNDLLVSGHCQTTLPPSHCNNWASWSLQSKLQRITINTKTCLYPRGSHEAH